MDHQGSPNSRFIFLPSFEFEINGATWYVFFHLWLLLLNIILIQFMCIHSLPFLSLFLCGDRSVLIYSFPWWWTPECYPDEAVTDSTAANITEHQFSSVHFSRSVVSDSLQLHGVQHAGPPCPSPTPGACSNSSPSSQWCHPTISFSVVPFSRHQSFPASGSFQINQFFTSGGQSIGVSAWASVLPMNIQDWFPLGWTGWVSLQSKGLSRVFSNTTVQKHQFFGTQLSLQSNSHIHIWLLEKP